MFSMIYSSHYIKCQCNSKSRFPVKRYTNFYKMFYYGKLEESVHIAKNR